MQASSFPMRRGIRTTDSWWSENRLASPALFAEELAAAIELIAGAPRIGRRREHREIPELRRVLMRATRYHVYYAPAADGERENPRELRLRLTAVW